MCSDTCRSRWEHIRANVYSVLVKPLRNQPELEIALVLEGKIARQQYERARELLEAGREAYARFLVSPDPIGWIMQNLTEHESKILGDS